MHERGICIPTVWNGAPGDTSHVRVVQAIRSRDISLVQRQLQVILAEQPRCVVMSCEGFATFSPDQIIQLRELVGTASIQVVHYVRRWPDRLPSAWQEHVRQGRKTVFPEFMVRQLMGYDGPARQDVTILDRYAAIFGASQIRVVSYSYLVDNNLNIAEHFLKSFLGLSDIEMPDIGRPNQSNTIFDIELIRALNAILTPNADGWSTAVRDWYFASQNDLVPAALLDAMRASTASMRLDEQAPPLSHLWRDVVTRYAACLVPPFQSNTLHDLRVVDVPFVRQDYLLDPVIPKLLHEIYDTFLRAH